MKVLQTAERVSHEDKSDNYVFQRSLLAYLEAAKMVSGDVLEIGAGEGYGIEHIAPNTALGELGLGSAQWPDTLATRLLSQDVWLQCSQCSP